jgi:thymidylate kinase
VTGVSGTTRGARARDLLRDLLGALDAAGVVHCLRNGPAGLVTAPGEDVDVLVAPRDQQSAGRILIRCGWRRLRAPGHRGHQFWLLRSSDDDWLKIDLVSRLRYGDRTESTGEWLRRRRLVDGVWAASAADEQRHREHRAAGRRERPGNLERAARRLPAGVPRPGPVVAVLGPDGAGKGMVVSQLTQRLPIAVTTGYLGVGHRNAARRGPAEDGAARQTDAPTATPAQAFRAREMAFLVRKWLRTLPTFWRAYRAAWRGHVVLLDRHPLDAIAVRPVRTRWGARLERALATRLSPRPDAVVVLDAPGEVLFARKGEHSPAQLESWRKGYLGLAGTDVHVLDGTRPREEVVRAAGDVVWRALSERRGWPRQ